MRLKAPTEIDRGRAGLSYVEVLVSVVLVALALVPALEALQTAAIGSGIAQSETTGHYHLTAKLEEVLAQPFASLDAAAQAAGGPGVPTSYSDAGGVPDRRVVYLSRYDGDDADADGNPFTGVDAGLLWVRVELEGTPHALETLTSL